MSSGQKDIRSYLATGLIAKQTAAKRAHGAALLEVWRLQDLLDAAATKEEDLLHQAAKH